MVIPAPRPRLSWCLAAYSEGFVSTCFKPTAFVRMCVYSSFHGRRVT